jgi:hypothetical protein
MNEIQILLLWGTIQKPEYGIFSEGRAFKLPAFKKYFREEVPFSF